MRSKQQQSGPGPPQQTKSLWVLVFNDLSLFASLCMAWFMIWKKLRRERKDRVARLKSIKLVPDQKHELET